MFVISYICQTLPINVWQIFEYKCLAIIIGVLHLTFRSCSWQTFSGYLSDVYLEKSSNICQTFSKHLGHVFGLNIEHILLCNIWRKKSYRTMHFLTGKKTEGSKVFWMRMIMMMVILFFVMGLPCLDCVHKGVLEWLGFSLFKLTAGAVGVSIVDTTFL